MTKASRGGRLARAVGKWADDSIGHNGSPSRAEALLRSAAEAAGVDVGGGGGGVGGGGGGTGRAFAAVDASRIAEGAKKLARPALLCGGGALVAAAAWAMLFSGHHVDVSVFIV